MEAALLHALQRLAVPLRATGVKELDGGMRADYLSALTRRYRLLELSTLVPEGADEQPVAVTEVFVPQLVRADPPPVELPRDVRRRLLEAGDLDPDELPEELDRELLAAARAAHAATVPRPVLDMVADPAQRLLVLLGDPGAGKSTLLRYLALAMTTRARRRTTRAAPSRWRGWRAGCRCWSSCAPTPTRLAARPMGGRHDPGLPRLPARPPAVGAAP